MVSFVNVKRFLFVLILFAVGRVALGQTTVSLPARCVDETTEVNFDAVESPWACQGTEIKAINRVAYPDAGRDNNYGSLETQRIGKDKGRVIVHWTGGWTGSIEFDGIYIKHDGLLCGNITERVVTHYIECCFKDFIFYQKLIQYYLSSKFHS